MLNNLIDLSIDFLDKLYLCEKIDINSPELKKINYKVRIPNKRSQTLVREYRIFDLIHFINFYMIKLPCNAVLSSYTEGIDEEFNVGNFIHLYDLFIKIVMASLAENLPNRFYNSQFVRIYIHKMSLKLDGVLSSHNFGEMRDIMRGNTLTLLKYLLWEEDLDAIG